MVNFNSQGLMIYGIFLCIVVLSFTANAKANDFCSKPSVAQNVDIDWLQKHVQNGWRIQFADAGLRARFAQWLLGRVVRTDENYSRICAKDHIHFLDGRNVVGNFTGFGTKSVKWSCLEKTLNFGCDIITPNEEFNDAAKIYLSYFDDKEDHNLMGAVFCFQNGHTGFMALTAGKTMTSEEMQTIVSHFKSFGLNADDRALMHSTFCP